MFTPGQGHAKGVMAHRVTCPKRAVRKCFKKATIFTSNNRVNLAERGISIGVLSVAYSNLPWKAATKLVASRNLKGRRTWQRPRASKEWNYKNYIILKSGI